jgi:HPt (histidine-containing phosphotransfer) domain-containing protein
LPHESYRGDHEKIPSILNETKVQENMPQLSRELLAKELESVERDIQAVEDQIANDPPDTSGELLRLREIQRTYRGIAASIKTAIALDELQEKQ